MARDLRAIPRHCVRQAAIRRRRVLEAPDQEVQLRVVMGDKSRETAKLEADRFYAELARLLSGCEPREYGPAVASLMFDLVHKQDTWRFYPLHFLVHSIEANCAYYDGSHSRKVTPARVNRVVDHYKNYFDPYLKYTLEELRSLELFALAMARQQFVWQRPPANRGWIRCLLLFWESRSLAATRRKFGLTYGIDLHDWIYLGFAVEAFTVANSSPLTRPSNLVESELETVPRPAITTYFELSSLSPSEVASRYHSARGKIPSHLHIFVPSVFLNRPLIRYDDGTYLLPHPSLMSHYAVDGLYRMCERPDPQEFHREFGEAFERYVGAIIGQLDHATRVWTEAELQSVSPGRTCDYAIDHPDCVVLVECKSIRYSATLLTENAVAGDNSTGKVAEALEQILCTAGRIQQGELRALLGGPGKPVLAFVVTFGDVYFANSPYYVRRFVLPRMHGLTKDDWSSALAQDPQIVSIEILEDLVIVLNHQGISPHELLERKLSDGRFAAGDWAPYLYTYNERISRWALPILEDAAQRFLVTVSRVGEVGGAVRPTDSWRCCRRRTGVGRRTGTGCQ